MNEIIRLLAEQAGFNLHNDPIDGHDNTHEIKKFAELIVQECISLLTLTEESALKMNLSEHMLKLFNGIGNQYANGIKEHFFGVEE